MKEVNKWISVWLHFTYAMNKVCTVRTKRIGLDWLSGFWYTKPDWTGSGSPANGRGLDWILSHESVSYSALRSSIWRLIKKHQSDRFFIRAGHGPPRSTDVSLPLARPLRPTAGNPSQGQIAIVEAARTAHSLTVSSAIQHSPNWATGEGKQRRSCCLS